ncbi:uncharacterized protein LOC109544700 isoform X2 [Dendroctonus ponderosae]|uniref:uncharacterized protein LOC109544700 isoform X2 n=1 Tax=Dendroctonus ponderosae TaxID=77166 RepID=UPI00203604ED|nr:uncharacterized protein LOC109544700 isoform X2 [Dendroctonus ponderosae]
MQNRNRCTRYVSDPYQNIEGLILVPYYQTPELLLAVNASMKGFFGQENSNMQLTMLTTATDLIQGLSTIVKYKLQFPVQDSIPQITSIIFNGQQFCTGPPVPMEAPNPYMPGSSSAVTNMYATHTSRFAPVQPQ